MLYRHRRQRPPTLREFAVYSMVGLSVFLLAMFFLLQELEAAALATIILAPATGLLWVIRMRQRERRWEQWRQQRRSRGEEHTRRYTKTANDAEPRPWWEVLEISERSTFEEVKAAYRTKIKQCHPDKVMGLAKEFQELADSKTREINLAFRQARIALSKWPP
jgi:DnaJ-domain-containing protein 1